MTDGAANLDGDDVLVPLPSFPDIVIVLSNDLRGVALKSLLGDLQKTGKEIKKLGEQMDRLSDATPPSVRAEKRDRYLSAIEHFADTRDTVRRLGYRFADDPLPPPPVSETDQVNDPDQLPGDPGNSPQTPQKDQLMPEDGPTSSTPEDVSRPKATMTETARGGKIAITDSTYGEGAWVVIEDAQSMCSIGLEPDEVEWAIAALQRYRPIRRLPDGPVPTRGHPMRGISQYVYRITVDETVRNGLDECVLGGLDVVRSDHRLLIENGGRMLQLLMALVSTPLERLRLVLSADGIAELDRLVLAAHRAGIDTIGVSEAEWASAAVERLGWATPEIAEDSALDSDPLRGPLIIGPANRNPNGDSHE